MPTFKHPLYQQAADQTRTSGDNHSHIILPPDNAPVIQSCTYLLLIILML